MITEMNRIFKANNLDDEMIDFIVKNTLWKANDLIKKEKENPGYIDKLYIDKLRGAEIDRVRGS